ncbi:MAG: DUF4280 domain-containing protein [Bacillota bacterium]
MKKTKEVYAQGSSEYEFRKDTEGNLLITYYNGESKSKTVCIEGFKEGDYGLWIEKEPPYYIENGQIVSTATGTKAGINEVLALKENKFLKEEKRIKNDFLWIHDQEVIVFPQDKKAGGPKTKEQSETDSSQSAAKGNREPTASGNNSGTETGQEKNSQQTATKDSSKEGKKLYICAGAELKCSFGDQNSNLQVVSAHNAKVCGNLIANIMDYQPLTNIMPFGKCQTTNNPEVASATAANHGNLTPQPCIPNIPAPWAKVKKDVKVGNQPALLEGSKLTCAYGGQIEIVDPGQSILKE